MTLPLQSILLTAIDNAGEGITVSDASLPDNPLIYVNKGFLTMTGYSAEDVLYKNCRFLQGDLHNQDAVDKIRQAVRLQQATKADLLNFKKDGTPFYNRLSITPVFDTDNKLTHYIGIQEDISALKEKESAAYQLARQHLVSVTEREAKEQEREKIGKELHDNINQLLATAKLMLHIKTDDYQEQQDLMQNSSEIINEAIEEIRKLSSRFVQPEWSMGSLSQSVQRLIDTLQPALPFPIRFCALADEQRLTDDTRLNLYRIIQEGVNNSIKYANPTQVALCLTQKDDWVRLTIEDDGAGFDPLQAATGIGLRNMESRLRSMDGTLVVDTAPGAGCRLTVTLPV